MDTRDALVQAIGDDPYLRWRSPARLDPPGWVGRHVVVLPGRRSHFVLPAPDAEVAEVEAMLDHLAAVLQEQARTGELEEAGVSVPQRFAAARDARFRTLTGGDWDWMWTTTVTSPVPGEDRVVRLDDTRDAEEIGSFTHRHNPRVWTEVGTGQVHTWVGVRDDDGGLVAVGGAQSEPSGVSHLAGILTHPEHRGRGLARAVSAVLTREGVAEHGVCTLGMYSDNDPARAIYTSLGYRTAHAWSSRRVQLESAAALP